MRSQPTPRRVFPFAAMLAIATAALPATLTAQTFSPGFRKLFANNAAIQTSPNFGRSVAGNEKWIAIGEPDNDDSGVNAGAVHLFDCRTGRFLRKLNPPPGSDGIRFGFSLALSGDRLLVGAPSDGSGAATLFNLANGAELARFTPSDGVGPDFFGTAVALSGNRALIGAPAGDGTSGGTGAAYAFDTATGGETKIVEPLTATGDRYGASVALEGNTGLIGAPNNSSNTGIVFAVDVISGQRLDFLKSGVTMAGDSFGDSVAISGRHALIGASSFNGGFGAAFVFDWTNSTELRQLDLGADALVTDFFGISVALSGDLALVGAQQASDHGEAYLFDVRGGQRLATLSPGDLNGNDSFGVSATLCGNLAVIGAALDDDAGAFFGSAYVFKNLATPLSLSKVAAKGDSAPGVPGATFAGLSEPVIDSFDHVYHAATLTGVPRARKTGVFNDASFGSVSRL
ncbi:MAG: hypothetical protein KDM91_21160, partial [Verrucomicrobiae bacterium]|nr:hypothetical protein [Verrucomicrobiae bacterium]